MKIHLTPGAKKQLSIINNIETVESGFVFGVEIGKHIIVEELFPINLKKDNIDAVYKEVIDKQGEKLIGPFFKGVALPADEGLEKDTLDPDDPKVYFLRKHSRKSEIAPPAPFFLNDWFVGDIVMEIKNIKCEFYLFKGGI